MAMNGAFAADTLVWTETSQDFSRFPFSTTGLIVKGSNLPGGSTASVVSSTTEVKGPNGVEFAAGRLRRMDLDGGNSTEIYVGSQVYGGDAPFNPAAVRGVAVLAVPEPETYALLLAGLAPVGCIALRRS